MRNLRRPAAAALATTLVLTAAGCGSGSGSKKDDGAAFKKAYAAESIRIKATGGAIGEAVQTAKDKGNAEIITTFDALAARAHAHVDALKKLTPPTDADTDLTTLERTIDKAAADLDTIVTSTRANDVPAVTNAAKALVVDSTPVATARTALDKVVAGL